MALPGGCGTSAKIAIFRGWQVGREGAAAASCSGIAAGAELASGWGWGRQSLGAGLWDPAWGELGGALGALGAHSSCLPFQYSSECTLGEH